jgi:hypothetical protein
MSNLPPPPTTPAGGGGTYGAQPNVPNYLVPAILTTLFCCLPAGIASIVFAAQVNTKLAAGDVAGAIESSNKAKTWAWVSFGVGLVVGVIYVIILLTADTTTTTGY